MKQLHFDVETNGFYGAYLASAAARKYPKEYRETRVDIEKRMCRVLSEWEGAK